MGREYFEALSRLEKRLFDHEADFDPVATLEDVIRRIHKRMHSAETRERGQLLARRLENVVRELQEENMGATTSDA